MSLWLVEIKGDDHILYLLEKFRGIPEWKVRLEVGRLFLEIRNVNSHLEALEAGEYLLNRANRKVVLASRQQMSYAKLSKVTKRVIEPQVEMVTMQIMGPTVIGFGENHISWTDGVTTRIRVESDENELIEFEQYFNDELVGGILDGLNSIDGLPFNLFKVYEKICIDLATRGLNPQLPNQKKKNIEDGRTLLIRTKNWASEQEISSFTTTMQPQRHAHRSPSKNPMPNVVAHALMRRVVTLWLKDRKASRESSPPRQ